MTPRYSAISRLAGLEMAPRRLYVAILAIVMPHAKDDGRVDAHGLYRLSAGRRFHDIYFGRRISPKRNIFPKRRRSRDRAPAPASRRRRCCSLGEQRLPQRRRLAAYAEASRPVPATIGHTCATRPESAASIAAFPFAKITLFEIMTFICAA